MSRGSGLRQPLASSPGTAGRIEFVILRTGHSPPVAPHLALQRRSYVRLRAGERLPEEDFHLPDPVRFRAHECAGLPALLMARQACAFHGTANPKRWQAAALYITMVET